MNIQLHFKCFASHTPQCIALHSDTDKLFMSPAIKYLEQRESQLLSEPTPCACRSLAFHFRPTFGSLPVHFQFTSKVLLENGWNSKQMITEGKAAIPLETTLHAFRNQEKTITFKKSRENYNF